MTFITGRGPAPAGCTVRRAMLDQILSVADQYDLAISRSFANRLMDATVETSSGPRLAYFPGVITGAKGQRKFFKSLTDDELLPLLTRALHVEHEVRRLELEERGERPAHCEPAFAEVETDTQEIVQRRMDSVRMKARKEE